MLHFFFLAEHRHKLPYPVNEDTGDAKYVKAQKLLTVTLEVLPWSKEEMDAEIARAEAALAAAAAETRRKQEEEERAAAEDAKRVVKKGFLDKRYSVCLLYWYTSAKTDTTRASWTTSNPTDRTRL